MQAAVAETARELHRQAGLLSSMAAAEAQQAGQGDHRITAQQPCALPVPKEEEGQGAAGSPPPQPAAPGALLAQQMLETQAADVERGKLFAELAQVGRRGPNTPDCRSVNSPDNMLGPALNLQACQHVGQQVQQVAQENATVREQLNLLWNSQARPSRANLGPECLEAVLGCLLVPALYDGIQEREPLATSCHCVCRSSSRLKWRSWRPSWRPCARSSSSSSRALRDEGGRDVACPCLSPAGGLCRSVASQQDAFWTTAASLNAL